MDTTFEEAVTQVELECCGDCTHAEHCPGMEIVSTGEDEFICTWFTCEEV